MICNQCGGSVIALDAGLDVSRHPSLIGLMLACAECGRPIRLLHSNPLSGRRRQRGELNRALRAARRMKQRQR